MTRAARLTAWLFLAAMLLAAAPRAWAHGAAVHEPEPQAAASTKLAAVHAQAGRLVVIPGFSDVPRLREVHGARVFPRSAHRPRAPPFLADSAQL